MEIECPNCVQTIILEEVQDVISNGMWIVCPECQAIVVFRLHVHLNLHEMPHPDLHLNYGDYRIE